MKTSLDHALDLVESLRADLSKLETQFMLKCSDLTDKSALLKANEIDNKVIDENYRILSAELDLSKQLHDQKNVELKERERLIGIMTEQMEEMQVTIDNYEGLRHTLTSDKLILETHVNSLEQSIRVYKRREKDLENENDEVQSE